ncbi:hypothetical protein PMZ80_002417 [Knufia obscura]|uniref:Uncharacterized protein n=2 Tax=Knufia TaxID=430999 RepID=A0AAN8EEA3_9EURO|nr:hypothetical protein PMZ80_002417 [Knufia obscura]KAK5948582.1 hypothetical protein OHC33_010341 [Knufia fluminis]
MASSTPHALDKVQNSSSIKITLPPEDLPGSKPKQVILHDTGATMAIILDLPVEIIQTIVDIVYNSTIRDETVTFEDWIAYDEAWHTSTAYKAFGPVIGDRWSQAWFVAACGGSGRAEARKEWADRKEKAQKVKKTRGSRAGKGKQKGKTKTKGGRVVKKKKKETVVVKREGLRSGLSREHCSL